MKMGIIRYTKEELKNMKSRTEWDRVYNMRDEDIILDDDCPDVIEGLKSGKMKLRGRPKLEDKKIPISIRLDSDAVRSLRALGPGWQTKLSDKISEWMKDGTQTYS
jgi:uncharacterized protein (DUF4415 family)